MCSFKSLISFSIILFFTTSINAQTISIPVIPYPLHWENEALHFTAKGNTITMVAGKKTDMFRDPNVTYNTDNAPKILFKPADNFVLTTSIEHAFANKWDGGAIVLKNDSLNWIKFCFEKDYTGARRVVSVVTKGISDDCNSVEIVGTKVFYKIAKADNVITLYYSTDGSKWFLIRHLQFETNPEFEVGFLAQSPTGTSCTVTFSNILYEERKISDPYTGQ